MFPKCPVIRSFFYLAFVSRLQCWDHRSEGEQGAGGYQNRHSCQFSAEKGQERKAASASFYHKEFTLTFRDKNNSLTINEIELNMDLTSPRMSLKNKKIQPVKKKKEICIWYYTHFS